MVLNNKFINNFLSFFNRDFPIGLYIHFSIKVSESVLLGWTFFFIVKVSILIGFFTYDLRYDVRNIEFEYIYGL